MATIPTLSHPDVTIKTVALSLRLLRSQSSLASAMNECWIKFAIWTVQQNSLSTILCRANTPTQPGANSHVPNHQKRLRFLVMGFTGKRAAAFKKAYIAEFDRMEEELRQNNAPYPDQMIHGDGRTGYPSRRTRQYQIH